MTTNIGKFIISDADGDVITIADRPNPYHALILDALRNQQPVRHVGAGAPAIQTNAPVTIKAKRAALPAPKVIKPIKRRRRRKQQSGQVAGLPDGTFIEPAPGAIGNPKPAPTPVATTPASDTQIIINGREITLRVGEPVFIAWQHITASEREAFDEIRESMGIIKEIRRGRGIRRNILVKWDSPAIEQWHHPDDLSDQCEYCVETHPHNVDAVQEPA
jgi:hypothetical protein